MGKRKLNQSKNRGKTERKNIIELPQHLIYDILVKIPPNNLDNSFRYVSKSWDRLINSTKFIHRNAIAQKPVILTQYPRSGFTMSYRKTTLIFLQVDETKLDIKCSHFAGPKGMIKSSCNGVILISEPFTSVLYVKNMVTGYVFTLPDIPSACKHLPGACSIALGFNPSTKQFKVVHLNLDGYGFEIFTIGSDNSWRKIPGSFKASHDRPFNIGKFRWNDPVCVDGQILHWFVNSSKYVISMDINDEKVRKTRLPSFGERIKKHNYDLLEMDGKLCFVYKASSCQIDVWVLEDFGEQIWVKKHSINAEFYSKIRDDDDYATSENREEKQDKLPNDLSELAAVATLRKGEVIMLKPKKDNVIHDHIYLYDFKHEVMRKFVMKVRKGHIFIPHRCSLWCCVGRMENSITS